MEEKKYRLTGASSYWRRFVATLGVGTVVAVGAVYAVGVGKEGLTVARFVPKD